MMKAKLLPWILLVVVALIVGAGLLFAVQIGGQPNEAIRLMVDYQSVSSPTRTGIYINQAGVVFGFERDGRDLPWWVWTPGEELGLFELNSGFYGFEIEEIGQVNPPELAAVIDLIDRIVLDTRSDVEIWCHDAGILTYQAFDSDGNPILLETEGDLYTYNFSPAAIEIFAWLQALQLGTDYAIDLGGCGVAGRQSSVFP